ncbi:MAG: heavy metal transporter [Chloroflexota bacterium]|nr:MAG: heavy metal transporter [Chloroflexota bacterium]
MNIVTFQVPAISCGHCVKTIEMELGETEGIINVLADVESKTVVVNYQEPASERKLRELLSDINYPAQES